MKNNTQEHQVIEMLRREGGYATLKRLNEIMDFSTWKTKTPEATVRRIVQESEQIFKVHPGLWALEDYREDVLRKFELKLGNKQSEEQFSHGYYQGLLVEIGKFHHQTTYVPAQDKSRKFIGKCLGDITDTTEIPPFTYDKLLKRAKTVDVIWFNQDQIPHSFFEVEHSTDIQNSLLKFYDLTGFSSRMIIVADANRHNEFNRRISESAFCDIKDRVQFLTYKTLERQYEQAIERKSFEVIL